ncbi:SMP-30/gluconolactonase/LRE family protein [Pararhodobacter sp.]|uniref:SMP-30/gluconolactonase/LRE family protein n=1 Tax=Pararhodobacter sp. TaxID=2127056 RepID=UPI002FDC8119
MTASSDTRIVAKCISPTPDMLGESPVWDDRINRLYWIDSIARTIRHHDPETGAFGSVVLPSTIGSIGLCADGRLVVGLVDGVYLADPATGDCEVLYLVDPPSDRMRLNDGRVDRQGRFVVGGMGLFAEPVGELIRVDQAGRAETLATGIRISNALCFSPDGRTMYHADSLDRFVRAYDYGHGDDPLSAPRVFADTQQFNSSPDGATVDAEGFVWVTLVNVGKIARFTPAGKLDRLIDAPTDMPTCLCFGGPDLSTLYVTSIKDSGSGRAISRHPMGGHMFALEGLGVRGLPEERLGMVGLHDE